MLLLSIHVRHAASLSFNLQFSQPRSPADPSQLINCTGDAYLSPDTLELTRNRRDQSSTNSTGRAKYIFTTTFSIGITLDSTTYPGGGMAFFLGHFESDIPPESGGASLGLAAGGFTNGSGDSTVVVAVEFDTFLNPGNADISYSHVGIDINSVNSTASTDASSESSLTKNLTSGNKMVATVRYENVSKLLAVVLKIDNTSYTVNATIDLRRYLPQQVAVGFSAATGIGAAAPGFFFLDLHCLSSMLLLSIHVRRAASLSFSFNLQFSQQRSPADPSQLINCTGDAYLSPSTLELTRNRRDQSSTNSTGRAKYMYPVPLWDGATGEMASFTTTFSFGITLDPSTYPGDGMAFFLGHFEYPPRKRRGQLGPPLGLHASTNGTGDSSVVAVEFDTFLNPANADISYSHVGIDINSVNSTVSTDASSPTKNLTSGDTMVATVRYENVSKLLAVVLKIDNTSYTVNATVDLRRYLPQQVAVGFSAATGVGGEQHQVLSWSFASTLEPKAPVAIAPAPPPQATATDLTSKRRPSRVAVVVISVIVSLLLLLVSELGFLLWKKCKGRRSRAPHGTTEDSDCEEQDDIQNRADPERGVAASGPRRYTFGELAAATDNFAEEEKLGRGGFGSVYRGKLMISAGGQDQQRPVAIKVFSSESSAQGRKEFEAEVRIISRLKHHNLVQLLGWCDSRSGLLLVYELVAGGSLDRHLHSRDTWVRKNKSPPFIYFNCKFIIHILDLFEEFHKLLTWLERYQIILGLGSALRYLHQEWEQCVVHGDIKPSNIMLDEWHGAKLGDFGLARLGDHGARWQTTKAVLGTAGYIDLEFVNTRHPSTESDVYSFGIVLLQVISGRAPVVLPNPGGSGPPFVLLKWVWGLYGRNAILDAVDERLRGGGDEVDDRRMERTLVVGLWCAHPEQSERPSIT
ncbi:LOW QUALITY PROTEIN: hypothetical protein U9M48_000901 [Paspalum notatum var. saurae]|uniref:non-specific serine/threonine protein kinase n=1 Tax=Paspalum notatum var. saurae TaxID=547442 RepID=A0AAQ3PED1_PASNO